MKTYSTQPKKEQAILLTVSTYTEQRRGWRAEDIGAELEELVKSSGGAQIVDHVLARIDKPNAKFLIGSGKVEEIHKLIHDNNEEIDVIICSEDLSSSQQRNLEEATGVKVIDRTQLILDIFAQRAHSIDGKLQVELAQLEYLKPRLMGKGIMLSRIGGGLGTRGPGEQKLEVDRRRIEDRITRIKKELKSLKLRRSDRRKNRKEHFVSTVAIVGYTNAGKSTLFNRLTEAGVVTDNRLFSTLDTTSHRFVLPNHQKVLFIDTVGFLHKLPHKLIEAFKATLEEVIQADLLLHVVDISNPRFSELIDSVYEVLKELNSEKKPIIMVLNKIDKLSNDFDVIRTRKQFHDCVAVSALKGDGLGGLTDLLMAKFSGLLVEIDTLIPYRNMNLLNILYNEGEVTEREDTPDGIRIKARVPADIKEKISSRL